MVSPAGEPLQGGCNLQLSVLAAAAAAAGMQEIFTFSCTQQQLRRAGQILLHLLDHAGQTRRTHRTQAE
jgi:hypothetical protein